MAGFTVLLDRPTSLWASIVIVDALGTMNDDDHNQRYCCGPGMPRLVEGEVWRGAQGRFLDKGKRGFAHTFLLSKLL